MENFEVVQTITEKIRQEIDSLIKSEKKLFENETDPVKKTKIASRIDLKMNRYFIKKLTKMPTKEFEQLYQELTHPLEQQFDEVRKNEKSLAFSNIDKPEEFEQYSEIQKIEGKHIQGTINMFSEFTFSKKSLERLLVWYIALLGESKLAQRQLDYNLHPFYESIGLAHIVFGFDMNWVLGLALIQMHENMIKAKYDQLGGKTQKDESLYKISNKLIGLIKKIEGRDVALALDMSQGLKQIRNRLTHEGFRYKVSQSDLSLLLKEIKRLQVTLFPEKIPKL